MELQVSQMRGELMDKVEISKEWEIRASIIVNGLTIYQDRLPPLLEGKSKQEMREIIKRENNRLRDWYCKGGEYTPTVKQEEGWQERVTH